MIANRCIRHTEHCVWWTMRTPSMHLYCKPFKCGICVWSLNARRALSFTAGLSAAAPESVCCRWKLFLILVRCLLSHQLFFPMVIWCCCFLLLQTQPFLCLFENPVDIISPLNVKSLQLYNFINSALTLKKKWRSKNQLNLIKTVCENNISVKKKRETDLWVWHDYFIVMMLIIMCVGEFTMWAIIVRLQMIFIWDRLLFVRPYSIQLLS